MPLAGTPVILNLLDGPAGEDPAFNIIRGMFRTMRRYLACRPEEVLRTFRMLDLIAHCAEGHFLLISAELGFAWDGGEGWVRAALLPLRIRGLSNTFRALFLRPGNSK